MDAILKSLYSLPIPVFGILVLLATAVLTEIEGILAFFGLPRREKHERESSAINRAYSRLRARRSAEDEGYKTKAAALGGIKAVKKSAADAEVVDLSE